MFGLRRKLLIGVGGLLAILLGLVAQSLFSLSRLTDAVDELLGADYKSVLACHEMKEALVLIDSNLELALLHGEEKERELVARRVAQFDRALDTAIGNVNQPGEAAETLHLRELFSRYRAAIPRLFGGGLAETERRLIYFNELRPAYEESLRSVSAILDMNQQNLHLTRAEARATIDRTDVELYVMLVAGSVLSGMFLVLVRRWVVVPLQKLTDSARQMEQGNLEAAVVLSSRDELGQLASAFNSMAAHLRELRAGDHARLVRTERATQLALNSLPDAVALLSPDGRVEMVNTTATALFGLVTGDQAPRHRAPWLASLWQSLQEERAVAPKGYEDAIQVFDQGEERFFLPRAIPIQDDDGRLVGVTVVLGDVTGPRKLDELKSGLLATASHELKTPLTSLQMAIHLLLERGGGDLTPGNAELLEAARGDVDRLRRMVDNILDLSRIEAGRVRLELRPMDVREIVTAAVAPLRAGFEEHGVGIEIAIGPEVPAVSADPARIGLVFANLLSNALKYTPRGGHVRVTAQAAGDRVRFTVADTGAGIPPEHCDRVFERFYRVPGQATPGAGLGLAIAKEIVEAHGGEISCRSDLGQGSTFTLALRAVPARAEEEST